MYQKTLVVNLFGQPGAGKSTGAAYIFALLKMAGVNAEYVGEFAKDKVWEENKMVFEAQEYIFGKQSYRLRRCADKVDVIVTDSPLLLSDFYNADTMLSEPFSQLVQGVFSKYRNKNYLLKRIKPYNPIGRHQTEEEATDVGRDLERYLYHYSIPYEEVTGCRESYDKIAEEILDELAETR